MQDSRPTHQNHLKQRHFSPNNHHNNIYILENDKKYRQIPQKLKDYPTNDKLKLSIDQSNTSKKSIFSQLQSYLGQSSSIKDHDLMPFVTENHQFNRIKNDSAINVLVKNLKKLYQIQFQSDKRFAFSQLKNYFKSNLLYSKSKQSRLQAERMAKQHIFSHKQQINYQVYLKDSLQINHNQIKKISKDFQANELIEIVNSHGHKKIEKLDNNVNEISDASISKRIEQNSVQSSKKSKSRSRTLSRDVYILDRHSKGQISTKNQIKSQKSITKNKGKNEKMSQQRKKAFSIDKNKRFKQEDLQQEQSQLILAPKQKSKDIAQQIIPDYLNQNTPQEIQAPRMNQQYNSNQLVKNRLNQGRQIRRNRFIQSTTTRPIIYINYQNSKEKSKSPSRFYQPLTQGHLINKQIEPSKSPQMQINEHHHYYNILNTQNIRKQTNPQNHHLNTDQNARQINHPSLSRQQNERNRVYSMPKIRFTYLNRQQVENNKQINKQYIVKNQEMQPERRRIKSVPEILKVKHMKGNNLYIRDKKSKIYANDKQQKILRENIKRQQPKQTLIRPQTNQPIRPEFHNNYCIPILPNISPKILQKQPHQRIYNQNVQLMGALAIYEQKQVQNAPIRYQNEYYEVSKKETTSTTQLTGTKPSIISHQVIRPIRPDRFRIKSIDTYVIGRPHVHTSINRQNFNHIQKQRSKSYNPPMQFYNHHFKPT